MSVHLSVHSMHTATTSPTGFSFGIPQDRPKFRWMPTFWRCWSTFLDRYRALTFGSKFYISPEIAFWEWGNWSDFRLGLLVIGIASYRKLWTYLRHWLTLALHGITLHVYFWCNLQKHTLARLAPCSKSVVLEPSAKKSLGCRTVSPSLVWQKFREPLTRDNHH